MPAVKHLTITFEGGAPPPSSPASLALSTVDVKHIDVVFDDGVRYRYRPDDLEEMGFAHHRGSKPALWWKATGGWIIDPPPEKRNADTGITIRPEIAKFAEDMERLLRRDEETFWARHSAADLMRSLKSTVESLAFSIIFKRSPDVRRGAVLAAIAAMLLAERVEED